MKREMCPDCRQRVNAIVQSKEPAVFTLPSNVRLMLRAGFGEGCLHSARETGGT